MKLKTLNLLNKLLIDVKLKDIKKYKIVLLYYTKIETNIIIKQDILKLIKSL